MFSCDLKRIALCYITFVGRLHFLLRERVFFQKKGNTEVLKQERSLPDLYLPLLLMFSKPKEKKERGKITEFLEKQRYLRIANSNFYYLYTTMNLLKKHVALTARKLLRRSSGNTSFPFQDRLTP